MKLVTTNPWQSIPPFKSLVDRFFNDSLLMGSDTAKDFDTSSVFYPIVDIYDEESKIVIKADLPGVKKEDVNIDVDNGILTLKGERTFEKETKEKNYYRRESSYGSFKRSFSLPENVNTEMIKAELKDGVLTIEIEKPEERKPKHISVN